MNTLEICSAATIVILMKTLKTLMILGIGLLLPLAFSNMALADSPACTPACKVACKKCNTCEAQCDDGSGGQYLQCVKEFGCDPSPDCNKCDQCGTCGIESAKDPATLKASVNIFLNGLIITHRNSTNILVGPNDYSPGIFGRYPKIFL